MSPPAYQRAMAGRAGAEVTEAPGSHAIYVSSPEIYWLPLVGAASDLTSDSFIEIASFNNGRHNGLVSAPHNPRALLRSGGTTAADFS
jgi:hypothetical protein